MTEFEGSITPEFKIGLEPRDKYRVSPPNGSTIKIAHISDTHLGLKEKVTYVSRGGESRPESVRVTPFENFKRVIKMLEYLDPDVIIHTGDIIDSNLNKKGKKYRDFQESLPDQLKQSLFLYIRGNHDNSLRRKDLCELLPGWDILPLDKGKHISIIDSQINIIGKDYQKVRSPGDFYVGSYQTSADAVKIGAFHQSIRHITNSHDANVHITHLKPDDGTDSSYYDLLLLGHMHTETIETMDGCTLIDGGSTLGLTTSPTIGVLTFSNAASHYQRYRI